MDRLEEIKLGYTVSQWDIGPTDVGWLISEVESLRGELAKAQIERDLHYNRLVSIFLSGHLDSITGREVQTWEKDYNTKLTAAQETICGLREAAKDIADFIDDIRKDGSCDFFNEKKKCEPGETAYSNLRSALSSAPTCSRVQEVERLKADYEGACKMIADMHSAAMGEVTGPRRGVVEDVADLRAEVEKLRDVLREIRMVASNEIYREGIVPLATANLKLDTIRGVITGQRPTGKEGG